MPNHIAFRSPRARGGARIARHREMPLSKKPPKGSDQPKPEMEVPEPDPGPEVPNTDPRRVEKQDKPSDEDRKRPNEPMIEVD
jgi:hypothetical protein